MIIVSITGPTVNGALKQVARSAPYADMFEFRLDLIANPDIAQLLRHAPKPSIATCRPVWEGGGFDGSESARVGMLEEASILGAEYIDIELGAGPAALRQFLGRRSTSKVIISLHLSRWRMMDVATLYSRLHGTGADVIKLAFHADDISDVRHVIRFLRHATIDGQKAIAIAMGEHGELSRILYRKFGGWATYAAAEEGVRAAPGQIPASQMKQLYRAQKLSARTKVFGVVGNPLGQSKGIYLHNELFRRASQDAVYCKLLVSDLSKFMKYVAPVMAGFSVTIPFKEQILRYLGRLDHIARGIGAVNTVLRRNGMLVGTNTDAVGALDAIERVAKVKNKRVLILGAGGAARAIAYEGMRRGAEISISNRTKARAMKLARELQALSPRAHVRAVELKDMHNDDFDILVNATPVGMVPHANSSPVGKKLLRRKIIFDAVYNPPLTKLLRVARSLGARIVQGTEMYLNQAALQYEMYTGVRPRRDVMRRILSSHM